MNVRIVKGSILDVKADVIVNPANSFLRHGGGLARVIADAAGPLLQQQSRRHMSVPTGGCAVTTAGLLPFKAVIHTVGPIWGGGGFYERELLQAAHSGPLNMCRQHEWSSIAFPAVSCGLFRFPVQIAAPIAVGVALAYLSTETTFALLDDEHVEAFNDALTKLTS